MNAAGGNAPADGGGNVNAGGNANVGGNANQAPARQVIRGSSKPPKFEGSFDLYRVEVELYLEERDSWNVVTGDEVRHANDADQQAAFDSRNRLARSTILRGLRGCQDEEANKICGMTTAKEMWDTLVADKTQRDFSYATSTLSNHTQSRTVNGGILVCNDTASATTSQYRD
ncbi:Hypothetical protein PHPALM_36299 [Phytophthora palmivora]|uniref:Uncharacterized protein n=1 Tax=Phytophthora palmivora TaxID=4796 RepID=A0A2P4X0B3_9STRA|nr:Hypothetical protein PHPALM_36299 [Phytophthora palmivora]